MFSYRFLGSSDNRGSEVGKYIPKRVFSIVLTDSYFPIPGELYSYLVETPVAFMEIENLSVFNKGHYGTVLLAS
jgi:hypothetical protein